MLSEPVGEGDQGVHERVAVTEGGPSSVAPLLSVSKVLNASLMLGNGWPFDFLRKLRNVSPEVKSRLLKLVAFLKLLAFLKLPPPASSPIVQQSVGHFRKGYQRNAVRSRCWK